MSYGESLPDHERGPKDVALEILAGRAATSTTAETALHLLTNGTTRIGETDDLSPREAYQAYQAYRAQSHEASERFRQFMATLLQEA